MDPAETSAASFRALDVRPGGAELLVGTHRCDLWELNPLGTPLTATSGAAGATLGGAAGQGMLGAPQGTMSGAAAAAAAPGAPGATVVRGGRVGLTPIAASAADAVRNQAAAGAAAGGALTGTTPLGGVPMPTGTATATGAGGAGGAPLPEPLVHGHTADVYCCAWNPVKPHQFASTCESANVYLWHAKRRLLLVSGGAVVLAGPGPCHVLMMRPGGLGVLGWVAADRSTCDVVVCLAWAGSLGARVC